jgi:hypothetical protein
MSIISDYVPPNDGSVAPGPGAGWRFHAEDDPAPTPWLIKGILPETGAGLISGQWGTYKTTAALDIAVSVMTGEPFAGRFAVRRRGGVCYLALEGAGGLASRLTAIARSRGCAQALPFLYRRDCPALTAPDALHQLIAMMADATVALRGKFDVPVVLVFVDTVVTAAGYSRSGDDNDAAVAQRLMSVLAGLSQLTGALVVGVDHFGKISETGTRGSSAKEGAADVVLALLADRETGGSVSNTRLGVRKLREGASGLELPFTPKSVEVGTDPDGDPITRVVIDWAAAPGQPAPKGWPKSLLLLRRILMTLLVDIGQDTQPFLDGPIVRACDVELVRAEFHRQYPAEGNPREKTETRRKAFQRALKSAQDNAVVMLREIGGTQFVWLAKNETGA